MVSIDQKATSSKPLWEGIDGSPGSKSMVCSQRKCVNVGDPTGSSKEVLVDKYKSEETEMGGRESEGS